MSPPSSAAEVSTMRALFTDARVCAYGFMDAPPLLAAVERAKNGLEQYAGALLLTLSFEFWLRALERRPVTKDYVTADGRPQLAVA